MEQSYQISWYAPNFINMCIDNINDGELSGRIYHCYSKEPWKFTNILQLIELADDFFDKLEFPQASTSARSFTSTQFSVVDRLDKVQSPEDFIENRGQKGLSFSMSDTARIHPGRAALPGWKSSESSISAVPLNY